MTHQSEHFSGVIRAECSVLESQCSPVVLLEWEGRSSTPQSVSPLGDQPALGQTGWMVVAVSLCLLTIVFLSLSVFLHTDNYAFGVGTVVVRPVANSWLWRPRVGISPGISL